MGTRSGDVDPGVLFHIMRKEQIDISTANSLINKHSGMLGITGVSSDMREIKAAACEGNERALLGLDMYNYRIRKYIGSYVAALGGVDAIVFTGGIGENAPDTREGVCKGLEFLGLDFDFDKNNEIRGVDAEISKPNSKVKVLVIATNEELVIAQDTEEIVKSI